MSDWRVEQLQINSRVRSVLVSHCVDLGKISFRVYPGKLSLRGYLTKLPGLPGAFTPERVEQLMEEMKKIPKVRRVVAHFDNWHHESATEEWVHGEPGVAKRSPQASAPSISNLYRHHEGVEEIDDAVPLKEAY